MKKIILFGNSIFAESIYYTLIHDSAFTVAAFTVDAQYISQDRLHGLPVVAFDHVERYFPPGEYDMLLPLSYQRLNRLREEKYRMAKAKGYTLVNYIASRSWTLPGLAIGDNCIVGEYSSIGAFVEIGNNVTIGSNVTVAHHARIKDHCFIAPGAVILGGVTIGPYCLIGANATIKEGLAIGADCLIGSGVTMSGDAQERGVYLGPPAERLGKPSDEVREWLTWQAPRCRPAPAAGRPEQQQVRS